jgi:hypothetical protein
MNGMNRIWFSSILTVLSLVDQSFGNLPFQNVDFKRELTAVKGIRPPVQLNNNFFGSVPVLKKPLIGAVLSATVPGVGEFYSRSWLKGALFLSAEIALWVGYRHFWGEYKEWDRTFTQFADEHWSEPKYWVFMAGPAQANISDVNTENYAQYLDRLRAYEREKYSHGLHVEKDQQYYEMIGKYDQFHAGWDDFSDGQPNLTPHRDEYDEMRYKSNKAYKNASACAMVVLANHLLSSFDAAWTIKTDNRKIMSSVRTGWKPSDGGGMAVCTLTINW